ncbi:conserved domain-containing protein [Actinokineospora alba]|uniref:Conserved domain-containing protein n=1 Tax=Actinokineospora alba TaxID=504798 RepID=A0A1H0GC06_9PSEU|nr:PRC and DUF2382 domain-containing protein [Actinokineospora alba]TDP69835.1 uncharacterized protein (TIGR02271 family) [Actinokineospora alba]SDI07609.1 conserved domain-containing protein [Actinokineospora alba]SDO04309.1 conserved domain-containing protein [Actinokineospora alba]
MTTANVRELANQLTGKTVYDQQGEKIGKVGQLWTDERDGTPSWVTVNTGLFGTHETFLPMRGLRAAGDKVQTPFEKAKVKDAPQIDPDEGRIDPGEEDRLHRYYGLADGQPKGDTFGPKTADAMTRSEEHLRVGTETQETGHARLRKYVVTETEQVDVPVTREEVRVEREPITDANREAALSGPEISEDEHEVTLRAERPVVDTETTPVERVRLSKEKVTGTERVSGEVRKERIETDTDGRGRPKN